MTPQEAGELQFRLSRFSDIDGRIKRIRKAIELMKLPRNASLCFTGDCTVRVQLDEHDHLNENVLNALRSEEKRLSCEIAEL